MCHAFALPLLAKPRSHGLIVWHHERMTTCMYGDMVLTVHWFCRNWNFSGRCVHLQPGEAYVWEEEACVRHLFTTFFVDQIGL